MAQLDLHTLLRHRREETTTWKMRKSPASSYEMFSIPTENHTRCRAWFQTLLNTNMVQTLVHLAQWLYDNHMTIMNISNEGTIHSRCSPQKALKVRGECRSDDPAKISRSLPNAAHIYKHSINLWFPNLHTASLWNTSHRNDAHVRNHLLLRKHSRYQLGERQC